jgi:hypothetical protein
MKRIVSRLIPVSVKEAIKHSSHYERRSARRLAVTSKRIDICASQIAHLLHLSSHGPVQDMVCLEVGSGWVLSHALVFHLLGARKVIATDLLPHAHMRVLADALRQAVTSLPRDVLAPFSDHSRIRERMDNLLQIDNFSFDALKSIGIEYVSPVDLARQKIDVKVDLVYSLSVLEHVPCEDVPPLLANLGEMLSPGGAMLHAIHLEDHRDFSNHPFAFLSLPQALYSRDQQSVRGNRLRRSEWVRLFQNVAGTTTKTIFAYHRRNRPLPTEIDASVCHSDEEDLRVSHVGMYTRKLQ